MTVFMADQVLGCISPTSQCLGFCRGIRVVVCTQGCKVALTMCQTVLEGGLVRSAPRLCSLHQGLIAAALSTQMEQKS